MVAANRLKLDAFAENCTNLPYAACRKGLDGIHDCGLQIATEVALTKLGDSRLNRRRASPSKS